MRLKNKMSLQKSIGNSGQYAEIIIDYEKKNMQLLDVETRKELPDVYKFDFIPSPMSIFLMSIAFFISCYAFRSIIVTGSILLVIYLLSVVISRFKKKLQLHKFFQWLNNDLFSRKKYIVVEANDIKDEIYQLPYEFKNTKLDYELYGDCAEQIKQIHIKPKPWNYKNRMNKVEQQIEDWDAFFIFKKHPTSGRIIITWI